MKKILFASTVLVLGIQFVRAQAAPLLSPGQPIIGVAATPGGAVSAIAVAGTAAGQNNHPAAEPPTAAIDGNTATKYLNFAEINSGFIVSIPGGLTTLNGIQFTTANDAPERDPLTITIEGTSAPDPTTAANNATWTSIYSGPSGLLTDPGRFLAGGQVNFVNGAAFNTYRVLVTDVRNQAAANSFQFSEVQFFGTTAPDTTAPTVANKVPAPGTIGSLNSITVTFSEAVSGVNATDLFINGTPAVSVTGSSATYTFNFPQPSFGTVEVSWTGEPGIVDFANPANEFDPAGPSATWQYTLTDTEPPTLIARSPLPETTVGSLAAIQVNFSEDVDGVDAGDLLINGVPATNLTAGSLSAYVFLFAQPATGLVTVAFAPGHGITDLAPAPNAFAGGSWTYLLDTNFLFTQFAITEFLASNGGNGPNALRDEDGDRSDWIEIYNPDDTVGNIGGYFLTDAANNPTKWRIPNGAVVPARGYLVIFASSKDRTNVASRLHSNFSLNTGGEYLGLLDPKTNVVSQFAPAYPPQSEDISYGRDRLNTAAVGYYTTPTPGDHNTTTGQGFGPEVHFSRSGGTFLTPFQLTLSVNDPESVIRYTLVNTAQNFNTAVNVPTEESTLYTGPITITNTMQVRARAFPTNSGVFPGTPRTESFVMLNTNVAGFASSLPIVVLHTLANTALSAGGGAPDNSVTVMFFETNAATGTASLMSTPQVVKRAGINLRGSSTQGFPKSSFAVELWDEFNDDEDAAVLGMPSESDWVLYAPNYFDNSLMHNPLYLSLSHLAGPYAPRFRFVEVFVRNNSGALSANVDATGAAMGDYNGIYVLEEKIKRNGERVDIDRLEPEQTNSPAITGGYLFKVDRADPNERTFSAGGQTMVYQEPDGLEMVTPARARQAAYLTSYINLFAATINGSNLTNGTGTNHYSYYFDVDAGIDHNIMGAFALNADSVRLSGYIYKPREGRITYGPIWDNDRGMGTGGSAHNDWRAYNPRTWVSSNPLGLGGTDFGTDYFNANNVYANPWYARLFQDPDFWQKWIDRWQELRATAWTSNNILGLVDKFGAQLTSVQPREQRRWSGNGGSATQPRNNVVTSPNGDYSHTFNGTYAGELAFQKRWLGDRMHFIDTNFLARPGFSIAGGQVSSGTVLTLVDRSGKPGTKIYYTLDGTDPRASQNRTNASAIEYTGPITITNNVRVLARAINGSHRNLTGTEPPGGVNHANPPISSIWSGVMADTFYTVVPPLIVTELMFNPPGTQSDTELETEDDALFEFIELRNIGAATLNLAGFRFTNGIAFTFPATAASMVPPGGYVVVANDLAAFTSRYGAMANLAGEYDGNFNNTGERVTLVGASLEPVLDFTYEGIWFELSDGSGFSMVVQDDSAPSNLSTNTSWRRSTFDGGSPGASNPAILPPIPAVLVNEALTHTDLPAVDAIELFNPGSSAVNIGGWFLSDSFGNPKKFQIPADTMVPAGGYVVFTEAQFNAGPNGFALGSDGDDIFLFSGTNGLLSGYYHGYTFGAAQNGESFGRYVNSAGHEHFVGQAATTLGAVNSRPRVGPVVVSEIMYRPPDTGSGTNLFDNSLDEFIEIYNITGTNVPLFHAAFPANTWRLTSGVDFNFPANQTLGPGGFALVVGFNPANAGLLAAFRDRYNVPANIPIYGPFSGQLDNSADSVRLRRPDAPDGPNVPAILVDQVDYTDSPADGWPVIADGFGASLQRLAVGEYGNDPTNWAAVRPTPGSLPQGGALPQIVQQPISITVVEDSSTNLSVAVASETPVGYQWLLNSNAVPGANGATLNFNRIELSAAGTYLVAVFNDAGAVFSTPVTVTVLPIPAISFQPQSQNVLPGTNFTISVTASGTGPLRYQWRFNGVPIPGETNSSISYTGADLQVHAGEYDVAITDNIGTRFSDPATLLVLQRPFIIFNPVPAVVARGQTARFSVVVGPDHPMLPLNYRWLRNGVTWPSDGEATLLIPNATSNGTYRAVITNIAGSVNSLSVPLTVLADGDGDGIPDTYENSYFASGAATNALNGLEDLDGDTMSNLDEFIAGTNPTNALSYLRVEPLEFAGGASVVEFGAVSNRYYTIDFRSTFDSGAWTNLVQVPATTTNRTIRFTNNVPAPAQYYRVQIPSNE